MPDFAAAAARPPRRLNRRKRLLLGVAVSIGALVVVLVGAGLWARAELRGSLPQVAGTHRLPGLLTAVTIDRDDRGVPTIRGASRTDVARALGFVHAQERFFQMDLARRRAAGELAALVGRAALPLDRAARLHRMRARAQRVIAASAPADRALLEAYTGGVNAGLEALAARPVEYLLLRTAPQPWHAEDCALVVASMFFTLQDAGGTIEARAALMQEVFPAPLARFFTSSASEWDTPLQGDRLPPPAVPGSDVFDFRHAPALAPIAGRPDDRVRLDAGALTAWMMPTADVETRGSNNWAVSGRLTRDGRAILADDMHLGISVPNTWFFASLAWTSADGPHRVIGVTLPGVPSVTVGSNGNIAWGFTNTIGDWTDRVIVESVPGDPSRYRTPAGPRAFDEFFERIAVKGGRDERVRVRETIWGPLVAPDRRGRSIAIAWVAQEPEAFNMRFAGIEGVSSLAEALDVANLAGIPAQNFVAADRDGHIGWTVAGRIPRREGFDGTLPVSWADGTRGWHGWYAPSDYPRVVDPPEGFIVTANNRVASGAGLAMIGDGGYDPGARARQIHDDLAALDRPRERDMLAVQLDDRALLMDRWRSVALAALTDAAVGSSPVRREFKRLIVDGWTGRASIDSVGYLLVRNFRTAVTEAAMAPVLARLRAFDPEYPSTQSRLPEGPVWALVSARPLHLLDPKYKDWDALLLDAVDRTAATLTDGGRRLADRSWGESNRSVVQHPLSRAVPSLARWLDVPPHALPGDSHMPRVQSPSAGASERLAVSPGHEEDGYFHMPGGQSGHPLSPHYADGHAAWMQGTPTAFLPGKAVTTLVLTP
jgi:penicillin G amidase